MPKLQGHAKNAPKITSPLERTFFGKSKTRAVLGCQFPQDARESPSDFVKRSIWPRGVLGAETVFHAISVQNPKWSKPLAA
jgi:hypothetical protein